MYQYNNMSNQRILYGSIVQGNVSVVMHLEKIHKFYMILQFLNQLWFHFSINNKLDVWFVVDVCEK